MANNVTDLGKVGITLKGEWNSSTSYERLDTVTYEGSLYIAVKDNVGSQPSESNTNWMLGAKHGEFTEQQLEDFKAEVVAESKEEMDDYTDDKKTELDTYTGTKKTELDTYEGTKEAELNTYASGLKDDFDSNATSKTNAFNTNATSKTTAFDNNATAKTTAFDTNASTKTSDFNDNATAKTTAFDNNATSKTSDFDTNVTSKTAEFDAHVVEKEAEFDENVDSIQEQITDIQEFIDSELEQGITEKGTRADVNDSAKWYGELAPEGRTEQKQLQGYNLFDYTQVVNLAFGYQQGIYKILQSSLYRGYYIPVIPGEHYYISRKNTTDFDRFRFCYTTEMPVSGMEIIQDSGKTRDEYTEINTIVPDGANYLFVYLSNVGTDITPEMEVQITKSEELLPYEPYVGGTASPNPDYPQEIRNVEGKSCSNLVGGEWFNGLYNADGSVSNTNRNYRSFKTTLKAGTYVYSFKADIQLSIVRSVNITNNENITITNKSFVLQNDSEISLGFRKTDNSNWDLGENLGDIQFQLNEGSTALPYEEYFEGKRLEFNICNKNLFDESTVDFIDGLLDDNGQPITGGSHYTSNFYRVKPSLAYKILGTTTTGTATKRIYFYDINKNWISRSQQMGLNNVQFTTPNNCYYIRLQVSNTVTLKTGDVMLCEGIDDTYVEHNQQIIPFPLQDGQKLMEGDYLADDGVHHVRGKTTLPNATQLNATTLAGVAGQYAVYSLPNGKPQGSTSSNNFISNKLSYNYNRIKKYTAYTIARSLVVLTDDDDTLENFNSNITGSIVEYEFAEEVIDTYTEEQAEAYNELKKIMLNQGVNHIWTETDGLEPNLQLTYYKSNKERLNNIEARLELLEN